MRASQVKPIIKHESKAIPTGKSDFEPSPETQALLKILELGNQDVAAGRVKRVVDVITRLRATTP